MDADLLRALLAVICGAVALNALISIVRHRFTDLTAISVAAAGVFWCALVGTPKTAGAVGVVLAFGFLLLDATAERAEQEAMQS